MEKICFLRIKWLYNFGKRKTVALCTQLMRKNYAINCRRTTNTWVNHIFFKVFCSNLRQPIYSKIFCLKYSLLCIPERFNTNFTPDFSLHNNLCEITAVEH